MPISSIRGLIARRLLVNYRVAPDVLAAFLPRPFRPRLVNGYGMAGICLIRLEQIRPGWLPAALGMASENAAHRIAVEWERNGRCYEGVYIPRRDTSSRLNVLMGGRLVPGLHHHARFSVSESEGLLRVRLDSADGDTHVLVEGQPADVLPPTSVFRTLAQASAFFENGAVGYSATARASEFDGLELKSFDWRVQPLRVRRLESSFFEDRRRFPRPAIRLDCALIMRGIHHEWRGLERLAAGPEISYS
jgi:hypothetical protein